MMLSYSNYKIAAIISLLLAVCVYILLIILLKVFTKDEIYIFPGGKMIYKILEKMHIYNSANS